MHGAAQISLTLGGTVDKRYQVFVSSTYVDLEAERRAVIQTVIELDCIPAGMELFPAADEEQFEFIKRVIEDCDYYLLIIGGRYGSTAADGVSYTEKEYDYAVECGLKVIALIHGNPDDIPIGKSEKDPASRARLDGFRARVASSRLVKYWTTASDLPGQVALGLSNAIKMFPATGWVRANRVATEDILGEVNEVRKENAQLKITLSKMASAALPPVVDMAGFDETFRLRGGSTTYSGGGSHSIRWSVDATWSDLFAAVAPYLLETPSDSAVKTVLAKAMFARADASGSGPTLDDQDFKTVTVQLRALGLIKTERLATTDGGTGYFWTLTAAGENQMLQTRVIRTSTETQ